MGLRLLGLGSMAWCSGSSVFVPLFLLALFWIVRFLQELLIIRVPVRVAFRVTRKVMITVAVGG